MTPRELRLKLLAAGFAPLPLFGKKPAMDNWTTRGEASAADIAMWDSMWPNALGTGTLTLRTPSLDLDILDERAAEAAEALVRHRYEELGRVLPRIGKPPKRAFPFRTDKPFKKIAANLVAPNGNIEKIEFLGDGQQVVVDGIHPDTGKPYLWPRGSIADCSRNDLPEINDADARLLVNDIVELLIAEHGYTQPHRTQTANTTDGGPISSWDDLFNGHAIDHDILTSLTAKLMIAGTNDGTVVKICRTAVSALKDVDENKRARRLKEIPGMVSTERTKLRENTPPTQKPFTPQAFQWMDPTTMPPRQFLFGRHYIRKSVSATIGGGGRAKTTLSLTEIVGMTAGRNLLTGEHFPPLRAWAINAEEDQDELNRRVVAICQHYNITRNDCGERLYVQSVRNTPLRLAHLEKGIPTLNHDLLKTFQSEITKNNIDVLTLDPFISFHSLNENDNAHMDLILKGALAAIAGATGCAVDIVHQPGKPKPGQIDTTVEDARGASSIILAARSARVLNFMSHNEAQKLGIREEDRRLHVRVSNGKANMGPLGAASWFKIYPENLPNSDVVVCASHFSPPDPFAGVSEYHMHECRRLAQTGAYRADQRSPEWIGFPLAKILKINLEPNAENDLKDIARVKQIIDTWLKNKVLDVDMRADATRKKRPFIIPGPWNQLPTEPENDDPF